MTDASPTPDAGPPDTEAPDTAQTGPTRDVTHIVDALIEERATKLMARPWLWSMVKAVAYPALGYRKAVRIADELRLQSGRDAMDWASNYLKMPLEVDGVDGVPKDGPAVVVANHPGGIADGIAVWDALKAHRPDMCFFANRDALRVCAGLADNIIPVEWREDERSRAKTRETLRLAIEAFKAGRCVVVFPAGRMAEWSWRERRLVERPWMSTAVGLARKFKAPITPVGVTQRMSLVYYALAQVSDELKNMTVFYELLAKKDARYRLRFGETFAHDALPGNDTAAAEFLRHTCAELAWDAE